MTWKERSVGLKHELNPEDDRADLVVRIDAGLARAADRLGVWWQATTPYRRQDLAFGCYVAASLLSLGYVLLTREVLFLGVAVLAYLGSAPGKQRGSLVEELQLEVSGLPKHTLRYLAVFVVGLGLFGIGTSLPTVVLGVCGGTVALADWSGLVGGLAFVLLKTADYIVRTTPNDRDGDRERAVERVSRRQTVSAVCRADGARG